MGLSSFHLRSAAPADMAAITEIYGHHVLAGLASYEEVPPSKTEMITRHAAIIERGLPYVVAETEGVVAAYAYAGPFRSRSAYRYTVEDSVYVSERFARQGLGKTLVHELINRCTDKGFRQMVAVIGGGHPASIALHLACGFHEAGRLTDTGFKKGQWLDTVFMQRSLGVGSKAPPQNR